MAENPTIGEPSALDAIVRRELVKLAAQIRAPRWQRVPFNALDFSTATVGAVWTVTEKACETFNAMQVGVDAWRFSVGLNLTTLSVAAPTVLQMRMPFGLIARNVEVVVGWGRDAGTPTTYLVFTAAGSPFIKAARTDVAALTLGSNILRFQIDVETLPNPR